nr:disease resistance protein RPP13-like isoform X4 [Ipomoea trifida]
MIFCFLFKFVSMSSDDDELGFDAITRGGNQAEKCHSRAKKKGFIIQSDIDVLCVVPCFANMVDAKVPLMRFKFDGIPVDLPYAQLKVVSIPEASSDAISLMAATNVHVFNPFFMRNIDESNWKSLSGIRANRILLNINGCFSTPVLFGRVTMAWLITVKERNLQKDHLFCRGIRGVAMSPSRSDSGNHRSIVEVLQLFNFACLGEEWELSETEKFCELIVLDIATADLKHWKASVDHFPKLERLILYWCYNLEELPTDFAEISTLKSIELKQCLPTMVTSAREIEKEQHDYGNDEIVVIEENTILPEESVEGKRKRRLTKKKTPRSKNQST